jgi:glycosyltransferase involved in cell wall biosynthesis
LKILLLTDGIYPFSMGGMQKHSFYLARYLKQEGVEITLAHCVYNQKQLPCDEEIEEKIGLNPKQVHSFHFPESFKIPGHYIFNSKKYSKQLYQYFKKDLNTFDLIYAQGFTAWHLLNKTSTNNRPPVIVNLHGIEMYQPAFSKKEKAIKKLLRIPAKVLLQKADYLQSLGGKLILLLKTLTLPEKVWECGIGIENTWFKPEISFVNEKLRFVFVGRHELRKGLHLLNPVLEKLSKSDKSFEVHFIGPVPVEKQLIGNAFVYHGQVDSEEEIKAILDKCDVLLLPSLSEGMPTVILEAMARGLAVMASDVGAVSNMVDSKNGWLIEGGNKTVLKQTLLSILNTPAEIINRKKAGSLEKAKAFDWNKMVKKYLEFFLMKCD